MCHDMNACSKFLYYFVADDTKEYVKIFSNIERLDQLQNYYIRCHKVSYSSNSTLNYQFLIIKIMTNI